MKAVTGIIKIVVDILLVIAISLLVFINFASSTVLSENYILSELDDTNYYEGIKELVYSNFENYIMQSGFDDNVVDNIVSDKQQVPLNPNFKQDRSAAEARQAEQSVTESKQEESANSIPQELAEDKNE